MAAGKGLCVGKPEVKVRPGQLPEGLRRKEPDRSRHTEAGRGSCVGNREVKARFRGLLQEGLLQEVPDKSRHTAAGKGLCVGKPEVKVRPGQLPEDLRRKEPDRSRHTEAGKGSCVGNREVKARFRGLLQEGLLQGGPDKSRHTEAGKGSCVGKQEVQVRCRGPREDPARQGPDRNLSSEVRELDGGRRVQDGSPPEHDRIKASSPEARGRQRDHQVREEAARVALASRDRGARPGPLCREKTQNAQSLTDRHYPFCGCAHLRPGKTSPCFVLIEERHSWSV
jgi:hypothetical protein